MCTAPNFSNRILYAIFFIMILCFKITARASAPPETDHVKYNRLPSGQNAISIDFEALFTPRDEAVLDDCIGNIGEKVAMLGL